MKTSFGYEFKTTPRLVQVEDLERSWLKPAWARFWEMRVGKGIATCYEMDAMAQLHNFRRFLVVCPKRVIDTWQEFIVEHTNLACFSNPFVGFKPVSTRPTVWVTNYERVWTRDAEGRVIVRPEIVNWRPEVVVSDESHLIKNRTAGRSRAMRVLGGLVPYRRALTGTPDPRSYADYWNIYAFLDPTVFGTWTHFANTYLVLNFWKQVVQYKQVNELAAKIHSLASRALRKDYFDIPEVEEQIIPVVLPPAARRVYKEMATRLFTELSEAPRETASASIPLTKLLRLAQISGGYVTIEEQAESIRWIHDEKITALCDVLEGVLADAGAQAVVVVKFRPEIARIVEVLTRRHLRVVQLHGDTKDTGAVRRAFREKQADVLVFQLQAGGLGIDLSTASTVIFYSWDFDAGAHQQAHDRIWKEAKQAGDKLTVIHLVGQGTVDETMLKVVQGKIERSALVLDNWQHLVLGS